jgi:hypothetical protein
MTNLFLHRLLNKHVWKTVEREKIPPVEVSLENFHYKASGFGVQSVEDIFDGFLRKAQGYTKVHQECTVCGDTQTIEE